MGILDDNEFPLVPTEDLGTPLDIDALGSTHEKTHKYMQHDASPMLHEEDTHEEDLDAAWAKAMTPEEYVLSSEAAMESAIRQSKLAPRQGHTEGFQP